MTAEFIQNVIRKWALSGWYSVYVPEYTYGSMRCDAVLIETYKRWVRGFEIKVTRSDFLRDEKWQTYAEFLSSLSIVCPEGLIQPEEIAKPFGLVWVMEDGKHCWKKKPKRFQRRDCYAWTFQYVRVIEKELPRLVGENERLKAEIAYWKNERANQHLMGEEG